MNTFAILGLVAILAFIAPFFARALRLPIVVGEILFGVIVGTIIHGLANLGVAIDLTSSTLEVLSTLGFVTLMFMIGMENDFEELRNLSRSEKWGMILIVSSTFLIAILASVLIGLPTMVGLILGGVSVAVVVPVLKELNLSKTRFGFKIMLIAQIADVAAIFLLSFSAASVSGWITLLELVLIPILFMLLFWLMDTLIWYVPSLMSRILNPRDQAELGTRAALASMLIFYGVALFIGIEAILGAFLSGMLFSAIFKERGPMMEKLNPLGYGFLIPIFFIYQGFEVSILEIDWTAFILLIFMTLVAFMAKIIPLALSRYFRHRRSDLAGAVLLGTNLSVVVAGVKIGGEAGILDEKLSSILILYGVISCVLFPMVFRWIQRRYISDLLER